jgi:hypothetical protein
MTKTVLPETGLKLKQAGFPQNELGKNMYTANGKTEYFMLPDVSLACGNLVLFIRL